jgi:hypothetical protein
MRSDVGNRRRARTYLNRGQRCPLPVTRDGAGDKHTPAICGLVGIARSGWIVEKVHLEVPLHFPKHLPVTPHSSSSLCGVKENSSSPEALSVDRRQVQSSCGLLGFSARGL